MLTKLWKGLTEALVRDSCPWDPQSTGHADLLEPTSYHDSNSTPVLLQADGWITGPNHRLLFWVPPSSRRGLHTPWTVLVIPRGYPELDLSRMAHGTRWSSCRDAST
ncbi:uncharacterized protein F5891DRAFT_700958 [Suillus fuscotomentosus]|uniref:Uncharacterized protein n=1 Tax=Suillus fuscotomentosus TaxID=1912939 RepID=A0AAD4HFR8_9AGAM|nr:uncharacterized protein F5891DRAFT_700958 [Suillus fuscotomentosus]KAG1894943.1 hypothetical protein F5891DRAFT_700958 [Suillus fuscotomentosus]